MARVLGALLPFAVVVWPEREGEGEPTSGGFADVLAGRRGETAAVVFDLTAPVAIGEGSGQVGGLDLLGDVARRRLDDFQVVLLGPSLAEGFEGPDRGWLGPLAERAGFVTLLPPYRVVDLVRAVIEGSAGGAAARARRSAALGLAQADLGRGGVGVVRPRRLGRPAPAGELPVGGPAPLRRVRARGR